MDQTPGEGGEEEAPADGPKPGLIERVRDAWRNPAYRFVFLFLLYLAIAATLYPPFTENFPSVVYAMMTATAQIEYWILLLFTDKVSITENLVSFMGFPVKIIVECTGIYEVLIFASAVLRSRPAGRSGASVC
jgi:hypothetical protein